MSHPVTTAKPAPRVSPYVPRMFKTGFHIFLYNIKRAAGRYNDINGEQCAASFAYYAFFSLFPLILLAVAVATFFVQDRLAMAQNIVNQIGSFTPLQQKDRLLILSTVVGVLSNGWKAGLFSIVALIWGSLRFFQALVIGVNRAWKQADYNWWKLPLRNLMMTGIFVVGLIVGVLAPAVFDHLKQWFPMLSLDIGLNLVAALFPTILLFLGILVFFRLAPRHRSRIRRIWIAALLTTLLLKLSQAVLTWYLNTFNTNAIYGVFGSIMGLLLWIYVAGVIIIFGGCLSATSHVFFRRPFTGRRSGRRAVPVDTRR